MDMYQKLSNQLLTSENEKKQQIEALKQQYQYKLDQMKDKRIELEKLLISICNKQRQVTDQIIKKHDEKKLYSQ